MKKILLTALMASATLGGAAAADARQGCGVGYHRGPYGGCRRNVAPVVVAPTRLTIGVFYPGRGYWDGRRYFAHRYRWHNGWRYR